MEAIATDLGFTSSSADQRIESSSDEYLAFDESLQKIPSVASSLHETHLSPRQRDNADLKELLCSFMGIDVRAFQIYGVRNYREAELEDNESDQLQDNDNEQDDGDQGEEDALHDASQEDRDILKSNSFPSPPHLHRRGSVTSVVPLFESSHQSFPPHYHQQHLKGCIGGIALPLNIVGPFALENNDLKIWIPLLTSNAELLNLAHAGCEFLKGATISSSLNYRDAESTAVQETVLLCASIKQALELAQWLSLPSTAEIFEGLICQNEDDTMKTSFLRVSCKRAQSRLSLKLEFNPPEKLNNLANMSANLLSSVLEVIEDQDAFANISRCSARFMAPYLQGDSLSRVHFQAVLSQSLLNRAGSGIESFMRVHSLLETQSDLGTVSYIHELQRKGRQALMLALGINEECQLFHRLQPQRGVEGNYST